MDKLKPCICGSHSAKHSVDFGVHIVICECGMNTGFRSTKEECVNAWNTRPEEERLQARIGELEDAMQRIVNWADAYPVDIFIPPTKEDLKRSNEILRENGISFTAINGATMKHVIDGVGNIAREVLND